jgi:hypothetical protein
VSDVVLGSGEHGYRVVENWARLPDGWEFRDVAAVGVDSKGRVDVGEVSYTNWPTSSPGQPMPNLLRSLQKLERVQS